MTRQVVAETKWLVRTSLVCADDQVACDRGGADHTERVDHGGQGAWMHRNVEGLIGLGQPAGRHAIAFAAE